MALLFHIFRCEMFMMPLSKYKMLRFIFSNIFSNVMSNNFLILSMLFKMGITVNVSSNLTNVIMLE